MELLGVGRQAEVYAVSDTECIKLFFADCPKSVIEGEAERLQFVCSHGVPSPACYGLTRINGRDGIRMERLYGMTMLRESLYQPREGYDYAHVLGTLQRDYHRIDAIGLGDMVQTLVNNLSYTDLLTPAWRAELEKRLRRMPQDTKLVHLDYHADNVIITPDGAKIIDWSGACAGNPLADAARTMLTMELKNYPPDASEEMRQVMDDTREIARQRFLHGYGADEQELAAWRPFIAASRLFCSPAEERVADLEIVKEFLA